MVISTFQNRIALREEVGYTQASLIKVDAPRVSLHQTMSVTRMFDEEQERTAQERKDFFKSYLGKHCTWSEGMTMQLKLTGFKLR